MIEIAVYRMRIGLNYSRQTKVKGIGYLDYFESLVIMALLLLSGIERNPGPFSNDSVSSVSTIQDEYIIKDKFSIVHYNVQSISNKIDLLESELMNFDVICITETWLDNRTSDDVLVLDGYKLHRRDRVGDSHGGICVYVKQNTYSSRRKDLELPHIECVWVEVSINNKKKI